MIPAYLQSWVNCEGGVCCTEASAIMDKLVAERDEAREEVRKWEAHIYPRTYAEALRRAVAAEAERDLAIKEHGHYLRKASKAIARAEAAEAEVSRLQA
jgi:hypothetical protein